MCTLSLCMIVKNEEKTIGRCLDSVKDLFDEIIIVDTGSTDKTKEIVKKYTDNVYDFKWINDFSAARNMAFSKATSDYLMWLDADDVVMTEDLKALKKLKKEMDLSVDVYMLKYNISFDNNGNPTFSYYRERIMRRDKNFQWQDKIHEYIPMNGNIVKEEIAITHKKEEVQNSKRNLQIYEEMERNKDVFSPRNLYYYGRELNDHGKVNKAIKVLQKFLDTNNGWVEDNINACVLLHSNYLKKGDEKKALNALYQSFNYDIPRPKPCTIIGNYFQKRKNYNQAIYWYQQAVQNKDSDLGGFHEKDYGEFYPLLNLVVCYDLIGEKEKAIQLHELTKALNPSHPSVIHNDKYFNKE